MITIERKIGSTMFKNLDAGDFFSINGDDALYIKTEKNYNVYGEYYANSIVFSEANSRPWSVKLNDNDEVTPIHNIDFKLSVS